MSIQNRLIRSLLGFYKRRKQSNSDISVENCLHAARVTATKTKYCFLITSGKDSWPGARLVEPICDLEEFVFFVGTNPTLKKVKEIATCPNVVLAFGNAAENANLVVYGMATISTEPAMKRRYWKGAWRLFFPNGPNGDDYTVVTIRAEKMEVLSFRRNVIAEPFGLRPMVLQRTPGGWAIQTQQSVPTDVSLTRGCD